MATITEGVDMTTITEGVVMATIIEGADMAAITLRRHSNHLKSLRHISH